ncbi:hypothetical protein ACA910_010198 [Epithemia clementina (nom. ined.)]
MEGEGQQWEAAEDAATPTTEEERIVWAVLLLLVIANILVTHPSFIGHQRLVANHYHQQKKTRRLLYFACGWPAVPSGVACMLDILQGGPCNSTDACDKHLEGEAFQ